MRSTCITMTAESRRSAKRAILSPDGRLLAVPGQNYTLLLLAAATQELFRCYRHILQRSLRCSIPGVPLIELHAGDELRLSAHAKEGLAQLGCIFCQAAQALVHSIWKEQEL